MKNIFIATLAAGSLFVFASNSHAGPADEKSKKTEAVSDKQKALEEKTDQFIWEMFYAPEAEEFTATDDLWQILKEVTASSLGSGR